MSLSDSQVRVEGGSLAKGNSDHESRSSPLESSGGFDESDFQTCITFQVAQSEKVFRSVTDAYFHYAILAIKNFEANMKPGAEFHFSPILVADNVSPDVLDEIPTMVKSYRVKSQVIDGRLFILDLSCGPVHGAGVANVIGQMGIWQSGHTTSELFSSTTHSPYVNGASSAAPDVVLKANTVYGYGGQQGKIVIIELEVSNRSVPAIRRDCSSYFHKDDLLYSVIAIKVFNTDTCPVQRVAAVQWVKEGGHIVAQRALDLSILPLTGSMKQSFATANEVNALPPVHRQQWERFAPLPAELLPHDAHPTAAELAAHCRWFYWPTNDAAVYPGGAPVLTLDADQLITPLVPQGGVPLTPADISDFHIDLKQMVKAMAGEGGSAIHALIGPYVA